MKLNVVAPIVLLVLVMFAAAAWSQELSFDSVIENTGAAFHHESERTDTVVWGQPWSECMGAWTSQIDLGLIDVDGECVEDFIAPNDYAVTSVEWWGARLTGSTPPEYFVITFYGYGADCTQPDTGTIISQQTIFSYNEQATGIQEFYSYSSPVSPVPMDADRRYWISIRAAVTVEFLSTDPPLFSTQWGWAVSDEVLQCPGLFTSEHFGHPLWAIPSTVVPDYPCGDAFAFYLYSDHTVSTDVLTWGTVKALYR